jgi:hypothetical protein
MSPLSAQGFNRVSTRGTLKIIVRPEAEGARDYQVNLAPIAAQK